MDVEHMIDIMQNTAGKDHSGDKMAMSYPQEKELHSGIERTGISAVGSKRISFTKVDITLSNAEDALFVGHEDFEETHRTIMVRKGVTNTQFRKRQDDKNNKSESDPKPSLDHTATTTTRCFIKYSGTDHSAPEEPQHKKISRPHSDIKSVTSISKGSHSKPPDDRPCRKQRSTRGGKEGYAVRAFRSFLSFCTPSSKSGRSSFKESTPDRDPPQSKPLEGKTTAETEPSEKKLVRSCDIDTQPKSEGSSLGNTTLENVWSRLEPANTDTSPENEPSNRTVVESCSSGTSDTASETDGRSFMKATLRSVVSRPEPMKSKTSSETETSEEKPAQAQSRFSDVCDTPPMSKECSSKKPETDSSKEKLVHSCFADADGPPQMSKECSSKKTETASSERKLVQSCFGDAHGTPQMSKVCSSRRPTVKSVISRPGPPVSKTTPVSRPSKRKLVQSCLGEVIEKRVRHEDSWSKVLTTTVELRDENLNCDYYRGFYSPGEATELFWECERSLEYLSGDLATITIYGRTIPIPRRQVAFGDDGLTYTYSRMTVPAKPWTPVLESVRTRIEKATNRRFNFVLINRYKDGYDSIGEHRDDEKDLDFTHPIASLSLGQTRDFLLRHEDARKKVRDMPTKVLELQHGSLLMMNYPTNQHWFHSLPKRPHQSGVRINMTFRKIVTHAEL